MSKQGKYLIICIPLRKRILLHKKMKKLSRRLFLKSATCGLAAVSSITLFHDNAKAHPINKEFDFIPNFKYKNGKFKIVQIADTHYVGTTQNYPRENWRPSVANQEMAQMARQNITNVLRAEKPDLVIHTGDMIFAAPAQQLISEILEPIYKLGIPFAVTLGNHDSEFGMNRQEVFDFVRTLPHNINTPSPKGIHNASNNAIKLSSHSGKPERIFYLFDTGRHYVIEGAKQNPNPHGTYQCSDFLRHSQIDWYLKLSEKFKQQNNGKPVPATAFMHMPIREMLEAIKDNKRIIKGNIGEDPGVSRYNSGLFAAAEVQGDIDSYVFGHEHDNDYSVFWQRKFMIYGRYSGYDSVYNDLKPGGVRVFEYTEGQQGFRSWIRLFDQKIIQDLTYPDNFKSELI